MAPPVFAKPSRASELHKKPTDSLLPPASGSHSPLLRLSVYTRRVAPPRGFLFLPLLRRVVLASSGFGVCIKPVPVTRGSDADAGKPHACTPFNATQRQRRKSARCRCTFARARGRCGRRHSKAKPPQWQKRGDLRFYSGFPLYNDKHEFRVPLGRPVSS